MVISSFHRVLTTERPFGFPQLAHLIAQMTAPELRKYLQEALFVNTVTYENQRAAAYIKRVGGGRPARKTTLTLTTRKKR